MKKLIITIAILLGLGITSFAEDNSGGLFGRAGNGNGSHSGYVLFEAKDSESTSDVPTPMLPQHGQDTNQPAPLGSGIAILVGLGSAYLVRKNYTRK